MLPKLDSVILPGWPFQILASPLIPVLRSHRCKAFFICATEIHEQIALPRHCSQVTFVSSLGILGTIIDLLLMCGLAVATAANLKLQIWGPSGDAVLCSAFTGNPAMLQVQMSLES